MGRALRWSALAAILLGVVLVPFVAVGGAMDALAQRALAAASSAWAAPIIAALLASDVFLPVPSSVLGTASGALLGPITGTIASFVGMTLGSELGYRLGRHAGHRVMMRLVGAQDGTRAQAVIRRFGAVGLMLLRPVPVLAEASIFAAGAARMPWPRFAVATGLANLIVALAYAMIGACTRNALSGI